MLFVPDAIVLAPTAVVKSELACDAAPIAVALEPKAAETRPTAVAFAFCALASAPIAVAPLWLALVPAFAKDPIAVVKLLEALPDRVLVPIAMLLAPSLVALPLAGLGSGLPIVMLFSRSPCSLARSPLLLAR